VYLGGMKTYPHLLEATGITIEKIRKERKMTKTALADFSDLQDCYVRGIIKGKRNPTITAIYSICEALGLSPLEFFKRVTDELNELNKPRKNLQ
jgi:transcriptional regulator with XRE-family HTH domain